MSFPFQMSGHSALCALPLPIFQAAVNEANNNLQTPPGMGLLVALAAASLTVQGLVDVKAPTGQEVAAMIMAVIVANSGERKSAMEAIFFKVIRQWEELRRAQYESEIFEYKRKYRIWRAEADVREKKFKQKVSRGEDSSAEEASWQRHLDGEPAVPVMLKLLYEDSTLPALLQGLRAVPTAGLISAEGGSVLYGHIFSEQTKLNAIWSGSPVLVDRVSTGNFLLSGVRLTVLIMVQPGLLKEFLAEKGEKARSSGLLARALICNTGTTQGTRLLKNTTVSWSHCESFSQRMSELLDENFVALNDTEFKRTILKLSPQAETEWLKYYNFVESNIHPNGCYALAGDHASKLAENVLRVAAIFHKFEGFEGDISKETLDSARQVVNALSIDFTSVIVPLPDTQEATVLDGWLTQHYRNAGIRFVGKNMIRRFGPNAYRNTALLDHVIGILERTGRVKTFRQNKTNMVDLSPPIPMYIPVGDSPGGI